uniref:(northern house mosquito) hypothetical protein n=1 Tax=Culex pipiens TaxID=7175 RepID=A0A8D8DMT2_CULPI
MAAKVKNSASTPWLRSRTAPKTSWSPPMSPVVVSTSRTSHSSSTTTWPKPSKITRIVLVVRDVPARRVAPSRSAPRTTATCFTTSSRSLWRVRCRRVRPS